MPSEFAVTPQGLGVLHPIPSVIDLPSAVDVGIDMDEGVANGHSMKGGRREGEVKMRNVNGVASEKAGNGDTKAHGGVQVKFEDEEAKGEPVKHYDAEGTYLPWPEVVGQMLIGCAGLQF